MSNTENNIIAPPKTQKPSYQYWNSLRSGQKLRIGNKEFYINSSYTSGKNRYWVMYRLIDENSEVIYLKAIQKEDNKTDFMLLKPVFEYDRTAINNDSEFIYHDNKLFTFYAQFKAYPYGRVGSLIQYDGKTKCKIREYNSQDGEILIDEKWVGQRNIFIGRIISEHDITIHHGQRNIWAGMDKQMFFMVLFLVLAMLILFIARKLGT